MILFKKHPITTKRTEVANQAACETLCSNNVKCALYESLGAGKTFCWLSLLRVALHQLVDHNSIPYSCLMLVAL
jgi:hypothetical protein